MLRRITGIVAALALLVFGTVSSSQAQVAAPNKMGVSMGHLHYHVKDIDAEKKFWTALGGQPVKIGSIDAFKFPDILIFLTKADASGKSEGSVLDHIGMKVPTLDPVLASLKAANQTIQEGNSKVLVNILTPDGDRIEMFAELTENARFKLDEGQVDDVAERHNRKMTVPITSHHIHIYTPEGADGQAQAWYVKNFGATPGTRFHYKAADIPGMNFNYLDSKDKLAPTKGRTLDHIGFEVKGLEAFCKKLQANGVKFDVPYSKGKDGFASAFLTDPYGTSIELTEGLNKF